MKDKRLIDLTSLVNSECIIVDPIKELVKMFDVVQAPRLEVKHYPIENIGPNEPEFIASQITAMSQCAWLTFRHYVKMAIVEKYGDASDVFDVLTSSLKIGKIKVTPPHTFSYVNTPLDELKVFAFQYNNDDGTVHIRAEINFSIEIY